MATRRSLVISLVEKGWAGARIATIPLAQQGMRVQHIVKGLLPRELVCNLTPYPGMAICSIRPPWFRIVGWGHLLVGYLTHEVAWVLVDNQKTAWWVARWIPILRTRVVLVKETLQGAAQIFYQDHAISMAQLLAGRLHADSATV